MRDKPTLGLRNLFLISKTIFPIKNILLAILFNLIFRVRVRVRVSFMSSLSDPCEPYLE